MTAEENGGPWIRCSEPHHTFRFVGRREDVIGPDSGPMADWLMWRSDEHEPTAERVVQHVIAIDPDVLWHKP